MPRLRAFVRVVFAFVLVGMPAGLLAREAMAQVLPNPNRQLGLHPAIANPAIGLTPPSSPHFAARDGIWNHGEGFPPAGTPPADFGGWHNVDDGRHVKAADVHPAAGTWVSFSWTDPFHPASPASMERFEGYLRPASLPLLPNDHPLYGPLPPTSGPFGNGTYVDQGAFELFRPTGNGPSPTQKILICIECWQSVLFPLDRDNKTLGWSQLYTGISVRTDSPVAEIWRTHLPGAVGLYNSMLAEDLDGEDGKELYVSGSWGLWRFNLVQP